MGQEGEMNIMLFKALIYNIMLDSDKLKIGMKNTNQDFKQKISTLTELSSFHYSKITISPSGNLT